MRSHLDSDDPVHVKHAAEEDDEVEGDGNSFLQREQDVADASDGPDDLVRPQDLKDAEGAERADPANRSDPSSKSRRVAASERSEDDKKILKLKGGEECEQARRKGERRVKR